MFETLTKGFRSARQRLSGLTELTEENIDQALRDVRLSLLEGDVELGVVKSFLARVKEQAIGHVAKTTVKTKDKTLKVGPAEVFIKICQDELVKMMTAEGSAVTFASKPNITGLMMVGLQGSGKTTSTAKLARLLVREHQRKPLLIAADVQRPGAIDQLKVLGERIQVPVFSIPGGRPIDICTKGLEEARRLKCDTVIFDTAGRLAIDETLMEELDSIKNAVQPEHIFFVVDAMIGQDAVKTAKAFHDRLHLSGVVLTKLDGDARGGAALSVREVTGAPVRFVGMGEELDRLEEFRPEGMASRILGMGDVVGLMKDFEGVVDEKKAEEDAKRMLQGRFTFDDFLQQIEMIQNMGPLKDILEKLPFFGDAIPEGANIDDRELIRTRAIVQSMTRYERRVPDSLTKNEKRVKRIAQGSGRSEKDVKELLERFLMMRKMMGDLGNQAGMMSKIPGLKQLANAQQLKKQLKFGGPLGDNPMMADLAAQLFESAVADGMGNPQAQLPPGLAALAQRGGFPGFPPGMQSGFTAQNTARKKPVDKAQNKKEKKQQKQARRKSRK